MRRTVDNGVFGSRWPLAGMWAGLSKESRRSIARVYVAASTGCFPELSFSDVIEVLGDLEFSTVEIELNDKTDQIPPKRIVEDFDEMLRQVRDTHRFDICSFNVKIDATGDTYYERFEKICDLAKATKVVTLTVPSGEHGTPFNQEVEHLQKLAAIAYGRGIRIGMKSHVGCLSDDPDTVRNLCDYVPGIGLTLDPSHYLCSNNKNKSYDKLLKYVYHVHLRDSKKDRIQVRVGQGEIDYNKLITQLQNSGYRQALSIEMAPEAGLDMRQELRTFRLLLDSLL
ncbi:MAG: sugar phosphate isomerase/epimerase [Planctomycetota bacterium]|nr:sugar phosphate isomerase/epimerase [Planctomycetota bacterium]